MRFFVALVLRETRIAHTPARAIAHAQPRGPYPLQPNAKEWNRDMNSPQWKSFKRNIKRMKCAMRTRAEHAHACTDAHARTDRTRACTGVLKRMRAKRCTHAQTRARTRAEHTRTRTRADTHAATCTRRWIDHSTADLVLDRYPWLGVLTHTHAQHQH